LTPEEAVAARVLPSLEPAAPVEVPVPVAAEPEPEPWAPVEVPVLVAAEPEPEDDATGGVPKQAVELSLVWGQ